MGRQAAASRTPAAGGQAPGTRAVRSGAPAPARWAPPRKRARAPPPRCSAWTPSPPCHGARTPPPRHWARTSPPRHRARAPARAAIGRPRAGAPSPAAGAAPRWAGAPAAVARCRPGCRRWSGTACGAARTRRARSHQPVLVLQSLRVLLLPDQWQVNQAAPATLVPCALVVVAAAEIALVEHAEDDVSGRCHAVVLQTDENGLLPLRQAFACNSQQCPHPGRLDLVV